LRIHTFHSQVQAAVILPGNPTAAHRLSPEVGRGTSERSAPTVYLWLHGGQCAHSPPVVFTSLRKAGDRRLSPRRWQSPLPHHETACMHQHSDLYLLRGAQDWLKHLFIMLTPAAKVVVRTTTETFSRFSNNHTQLVITPSIGHFLMPASGHDPQSAGTRS